MGTPIEEQQMFQNVTSVIAASEPQITECNMLSMDFINQVSYNCWSEKILYFPTQFTLFANFSTSMTRHTKYLLFSSIG